MHPEILRHQDAIAALCRRFGVTRLEVFGSAARGDDFDPARSDVDLLVEFTPEARFDFAAFADLKDALEALLGREVDLIDRPAIEKSHNPIRRATILGDAQLVFTTTVRPSRFAGLRAIGACRNPLTTAEIMRLTRGEDWGGPVEAAELLKGHR